MRQLFAMAVALILISAIVAHLVGYELVAELVGDIAFFTLLAAIVVPERRMQTQQHRE